MSAASQLDSIEVYVDAAGEHRWRFVAANGNVLADSAEGYERRDAAVRGLEHVLGGTVSWELPEADGSQVGLMSRTVTGGGYTRGVQVLVKVMPA